MDSSMPGFPVLYYLLESAQAHVHWNQWCHPSFLSSVTLFSSCLQSFPTSESFPMRWLFQSSGQVLVLQLHYQSLWYWKNQDWFFFRIDWFDLLAVQGTLKSLFQHHRSKASILWCSVFFMVQLSHPYMTTGKTTALTIQTFVGKVMSLLLIC